MRAAFFVLGASCVLVTEIAAQADTLRAQRERTVDEWMAQAVRRPAWVRKGPVHHVANVVSFVGGTAPLVLSSVDWIAGSSSDYSGEPVGRTTMQAILAGSLVTGALKFTLGRARPYVTADSNSRDFAPGRGWRNDAYRSLPSGHTTMAFAFATALSQEQARREGRSARFEAWMYGGATLVAISRIVLDKHWLTDVVLGAAIGTASGAITYRLAH